MDSEIVRVSGSRIEKCKRCRKEATGADDPAAVLTPTDCSFTIDAVGFLFATATDDALVVLKLART
jgi:hypothetical protein